MCTNLKTQRSTCVFLFHVVWISKGNNYLVPFFFMFRVWCIITAWYYWRKTIFEEEVPKVTSEVSSHLLCGWVFTGPGWSCYRWSSVQWWMGWHIGELLVYISCLFKHVYSTYFLYLEKTFLPYILATFNVCPWWFQSSLHKQGYPIIQSLPLP